MRQLAFVLLLVFAAGCDPASMEMDAGRRTDAAPDGGPPADLDGFIEFQMGVGGVPGLAAAIVKGNEIVWVGTYGFADIEASRAVDAHTLFVIASISKTFAATRAMQLVEAGMLDLDEPVETYLPYAVRHPDFPDTPITTRKLLTHTAGLEDDWAPLADATTSGTDPTETLTGFAQGYVTPGGTYYSAANWGAEAGVRRSYCNAAFGVVGDIIERAGAAGFRAQTGTGIFDPLALDGAGFFLADIDLSRVAVPYGWNGHTYSALPQSGFAFYPASSLRISITGLSRFLIAIANGGILDGTRILNADTVTEMLRIQYPTISRSQALTWSERSVNGNLYIGHSGSTIGGSCQMLLRRDGSYGILLLTNSDAYIRSELGLPIGDNALEAILTRLDQEAQQR